MGNFSRKVGHHDNACEARRIVSPAFDELWLEEMFTFQKDIKCIDLSTIPYPLTVDNLILMNK